MTAATSHACPHLGLPGCGLEGFTYRQCHAEPFSRPLLAVAFVPGSSRTLLRLTQTPSSKKEPLGSHCVLAPKHRPQTTGAPGHATADCQHFGEAPGWLGVLQHRKPQRWEEGQPPNTQPSRLDPTGAKQDGKMKPEDKHRRISNQPFIQSITHFETHRVNFS